MPPVPLFSHSFAGIACLTLLLFGQSTKAQTGACQSYEAAFKLEAGMRDGSTLQQAKDKDSRICLLGWLRGCFSSIKNEINQMPYAFPLVNQAL